MSCLAFSRVIFSYQIWIPSTWRWVSGAVAALELRRARSACAPASSTTSYAPWSRTSPSTTTRMRKTWSSWARKPVSRKEFYRYNEFLITHIYSSHIEWVFKEYPHLIKLLETHLKIKKFVVMNFFNPHFICIN